MLGKNKNFSQLFAFRKQEPKEGSSILGEMLCASYQSEYFVTIDYLQGAGSTQRSKNTGLPLQSSRLIGRENRKISDLFAEGHSSERIM